MPYNYIVLTQRLTILKTQIRKSSKAYFDSLKDELQGGLTFDTTMDAMERKFVTTKFLENYKLILNDMKQGVDEPPHDFYSRLQEVTRLAKQDDNEYVLVRSRHGLQLKIARHCIQFGSINEKQWIKNIESWWNANKTFNHKSSYTLITHNTSTFNNNNLGMAGLQLLGHNESNADILNVMDINHRQIDSNSLNNSNPVVVLLEPIVSNIQIMEKNVNDKIEQMNSMAKKSHKNDMLTRDDIIKL
ncbi:unnamed protein product [Cunninghamella blakesleeana]